MDIIFWLPGVLVMIFSGISLLSGGSPTKDAKSIAKRNAKLKAKIPVPYEYTQEYVEILRTARDCDLAFPHDPYIPWEQRLEKARKLIEPEQSKAICAGSSSTVLRDGSCWCATCADNRGEFQRRAQTKSYYMPGGRR